MFLLKARLNEVVPRSQEKERLDQEEANRPGPEHDTTTTTVTAIIGHLLVRSGHTGVAALHHNIGVDLKQWPALRAHRVRIHQVWELGHLGGRSGRRRPDPAHGPPGDILSATNRHNGQFELYTIDITTLDEHRITHNPATDIYGSYSPDDATLLFMSDRGGDFDIYAKEVLSGVVTRLTESKAFDAFPDWSPDGTQIAWNCRRDHSLEICVAGADGSGEVAVAAHQADEFTPSWQPIPPG